MIIKTVYESVFGTYSKKIIKKYMPLVKQVSDLEPKISALSDAELAEKTTEFKNRLANGETLDDIMIEAFAVVREAGKRTIDKRHFDVQILGGILLHKGNIVEMKTGEGKTLVSTLPAYLNALLEKGVHIITVNDYLARRDSEWMGKIHRFLGLTVGVVVSDLKPPDRRTAYASDITYGTNNEFGFDYLRDHMAIYQEELVQRDLHYAIIDEVDSVLIDEARTPLIISGKSDKSTQLYQRADLFVRTLIKGRVITPQDKMTMIMKRAMDEEGDFVVDEKAHTVVLTGEGVTKAERYFSIENLADSENIEIQHHINIALRAHYLMKLEKDYIVVDGKIVIVDEFTGRLMPGRRYSDGLHQAIEAKEKVEVKSESKTLATITLQSYFNKYDKKAGMTGTALTEEDEFREIYNVACVELPTNKPVVRKDLTDQVYKTRREKLNGIVKAIAEAHEIGQPVLVGTITIEASEEISKMLSQKRINHQVLNAKFHEREAEIVAQAGRFKNVTIATNMAGRGTDIILGGNPEYMAKMEMRRTGTSEELIAVCDSINETDNEEIMEVRKRFSELKDQYKQDTDAEREKVIAVGGLKIIGTERHESRRIDNQLRGRAGRQGDPGETRFYISLEDDLMRLFGSERMLGLLNSMNMPEGLAIEHGMLSGTIETAQKKVEERNFGTRKRLLEYDNVMNEQRKVIYDERSVVLNGEDVKHVIMGMVDDIIDLLIQKNILNVQEDPNVESLIKEFCDLFPVLEEFTLDLEALYVEDVRNKLKGIATDLYEKKEQEMTEKIMREAERVVLLKIVDEKWIDHIDAMEQMKQWIVLQGYAQRDPLIEYQITSNDMFEALIQDIKFETIRNIYNVRAYQKIEREKVAKNMVANHGDEEMKQKQRVKENKKDDRNALCPCGSGKKYKHCCGKQL